MTEEKKKKSKPDAVAPKAPEDDARVGDILRRAREEKGLSLEDVSAATHIRVAQLRAIEEGNMEGLPGMIYALGFVKSYAGTLKLDSAEISQLFKAEHANDPIKSNLQFPEPIAEDKLPGPFIVGGAAVFALLLLILWSFFSGDDGNTEVADIKPPPAATSMEEDAAVPELPADFVPAMLEPVPAEPVAVQQPAALAPVVSAPEQSPSATAPEVKTAEKASPPPEEVIEVKQPKSRIVLQANQTSWVQVSDARQNVIFKKVMKAGEKFPVPDKPGLSLVTSNAGGIDIYVDGAKVQSLGKAGQIVRGIDLEPSSLKKRRTRVRDY